MKIIDADDYFLTCIGLASPNILPSSKKRASPEGPIKIWEDDP